MNEIKLNIEIGENLAKLIIELVRGQDDKPAENKEVTGDKPSGDLWQGLKELTGDKPAEDKEVTVHKPKRKARAKKEDTPEPEPEKKSDKADGQDRIDEVREELREGFRINSRACEALFEKYNAPGFKQIVTGGNLEEFAEELSKIVPA